MYLLMNKDVSGQRFVIVSENYSYKKLLTTIADMLQVKKPRYKISKTILSLAWRIDWIICLFFMQKRKLSRDMARSLITKDSYDNEKIKKLLDYQFETVQTTLSKVIASTATAAH